MLFVVLFLQHCKTVIRQINIWTGIQIDPLFKMADLKFLFFFFFFFFKTKAVIGKNAENFVREGRRNLSVFIIILCAEGPSNTDLLCVLTPSHMHHRIDQNILIANINSRFSGEVVELVVLASVFNLALLPDDETLLRAYGNSKLSTLANFYGKKKQR